MDQKQTKNLCAQIPLSLHEKVRQAQTAAEQSLGEYITEVLTKYYDYIEGGATMANVRTLAVQVPEDLFQKLKTYLEEESARRGKKLTQKEFLLELIQQAVEDKQSAT